MKIPSLICSLAALTAMPVHAQAIVGSWSIKSSADNHSDAVVTFLRNGVYVIAEDGNPAIDPNGKDGMERGTYKWNPTTKALSVRTLVDTNGEWGFSHANLKSAKIKDNKITIVDGKESFSLQRVASKNNPLVGGWFAKDGSGYAAISFLPDGTYLMAQDGDETKKEKKNGMERGTYKWNPSTNAFSRKIITDTNGSWGLSGQANYSFKVTKNKLVINGDYTLARVVAPKRPLIGVEQPVGTFLKDGKTKKNFGKAAIGTTKSRTFTILNNGTSNLTNLAISKSGSHKGNFRVSALKTTTLKPGYSTTFKVTFKPSATGTRNAAIAITSNDSKSGPFDILLTGVGE